MVVSEERMPLDLPLVADAQGLLPNGDLGFVHPGADAAESSGCDVGSASLHLLVRADGGGPGVTGTSAVVSGRRPADPKHGRAAPGARR